VDEIPPFEHTAAEMKAMLDQLLTKGVVEGDAGPTLMLMPKGLTLEKLQSMGVPCQAIYAPIQQEFGSKKNEKNYWLTMSNNILIDSRNESPKQQQDRVEKMGGKMPNFLEGYALPVVTSILQTKKGVKLAEAIENIDIDELIQVSHE
jgi:hypothetical protein